MKLYNTLTKTVEEFVPHESGKVKMYTCGPTVYHYAHIGNLRSYMMEDVLEKYLRFAGYDVKRAMNITDVGHLTSDADTGEDKMLKGAKREHKTVMQVAQFYTDAFFADCDALNIKKPEIVQPATGCIDDFIRVISALIDKGYAYVAGGNVYFDTSKSENYGELAGHADNTENLMVGVRDDPWGVGYPGWHIECSCISMKYLGEYLDIHCGGVDNIFPHHTNEIAQSEAYLGHKWCGYWFHVQHLNDETGKMSKSKGEFLTVSLLKSKGYDPLAYRYFCLQSHYRKPLTFSFASLDNAAAAYSKLYARVAATERTGEIDEAKVKALLRGFDDAMSNDLNTSLAVTSLYDILKSDATGAEKRAAIDAIDSVLSLGLKDATVKKEEPAAEEGDPAILEKIAERAAAKKAKDYAKADAIRAELLAQGIVLIDTPNGTTYKKQ